MPGNRADVLTTPAPALDTAAIRIALREHWGVDCALIRPLGAERDANFLIDDTFVLKVSNPAESDAAVDMETAALELVRRVAPDLPVPEQVLVAERDAAIPGGPLVAHVVDGTGARCLGRLFTALRGTALEGAVVTTDMAHRVGALSARMSVALQGFFHVAGGRKLDWDIRRYPAIAPPDGPMAELARRVAAPLVATNALPAGIQHGDLTLTNILAENDDVTGIVDFGDMHHTAAVCDFAVTLASVMRNSGPDPQPDMWELAAAVIDGYQRIRPLSAREAEVLGELVLARLGTTALISARRAPRFRDNHAYITQYDAGNARALRELTALTPTELSRRMLRLAGLAHIAVSTPHTTPAADAALARRRHAVMAGRLSPLFYRTPLHIVRGDGPWVYTADGRRLLDAYNNVAVVGHCHPAVTQAVARQLATLNTHSRYLHEGIVLLAERVLAAMPAPLDVCLFTTSGTEANELAWRLATAYTGGTGAMIVEHAYHGSTRWMADLSPNEWPAGFRPAHVATFAAPRGVAEADCRNAALQRVSSAADALAAAGERPALLLADSMFTSEGVLDAPGSFFHGMAEAAHRAGALYLADEVQAGYGRSGPELWRFARSGVVPDIVSLGKPMGAGYPLAAVITRSDIAAALARDYEYFSTFAATPAAAAAGIAVLDVLRDRHLPEKAVEVGDYLSGCLREIAAQRPELGDVRHCGLMIGIDLVAGDGPAPRPWANKLLQNLVIHGVIAGLTGPGGTVLKVRPPLVWSHAHADIFVDALQAALAATAGREPA